MLTPPPPPPQRKPVGGGYKLIEPLKIKINENLTHSSLTYIQFNNIFLKALKIELIIFKVIKTHYLNKSKGK